MENESIDWRGRWNMLFDGLTEMVEMAEGHDLDELGGGHVNALLGSVRLIQPFNWVAWGVPYPTNEEIASLSLLDCVRHITRISRVNRTNEGALADALRSGMLVALCHRARLLANDGPVGTLAEMEAGA